MNPNIYQELSENMGGVSGEDLFHSHAGKRVLRFWEMDALFKCPVVGACLTLSEQKQILKKACTSVRDKSDYEIHEILVASCDSENKISKRIDRLLQRKYLHKASSLIGLDEGAFLEYWKEYFEIGDMGFLVYAAAIKADLSRSSEKEIFGLIHMNMHDTANTKAELRRNYAEVGEKMMEAEERSEELVKTNRSLRKENKKLRESWEQQRADLHRSRSTIDTLKHQLERLKNKNTRLGPPDNDQHTRTVSERKHYAELSKSKNEVQALENKNLKLKVRIDHQENENLKLRQHLQGVLRQVPDKQLCDSSCPSFDLCRKRVLLVGGITKMENLYREIIESKGGRLEYHNGNIKCGIKALEGRFKRADIVLCSVDCNSHAACTVVKKLGKKHGKPVQMLSGSSLSAVSLALEPESSETSGVA